MKRNYVEIFVCLEQNDKVTYLFEGLAHVVYFDSYDALKEKLNNLDYGHSHILVVDYKYILSSDNKIKKCINDELMYKGASVGVYGENIPLNIKEQIYALEFKGIFGQDKGTHKEILSNMMVRSNVYAATFGNNFLKGIMRFHNIVDECKSSLYLLNYLIKHYDISNQEASRIRSAFILLMLAFHENKFFQTSKFLKTLFKSKETSELYQNYMTPKTFSETVVSQLLLQNQSDAIKKFTQRINSTTIPVELAQTVEKFANSKAIVVSSYQDINFFWEEINTFVLEKRLNEDEIFEKELSDLYKILIDALLYLNYYTLSVDTLKTNELLVRIHCKENHHDDLENHWNTLVKQNANIKLYCNKEEVFYEIVVSNSHHDAPQGIKAEIEDVVACEALLFVNKVIDKSSINTMHYQDTHKISAQEFLQDFELDQYLLDELHENESEMKNTLFLEDELSQNMIDSVIETLDRYVRVLHGTIEFEDIGFSLNSLAQFLGTLDMSSLDEEKKNTLRFYIFGLINDLSSWKQYIFIEPNTPDIHYLDASLLENCAEIERFITQKSDEVVQSDEDEMEFF